MAFATKGDGVAIPNGNRVVISTTIDVLDDTANPIGFVQSLNRTDTRRVDRIRHLGAVEAGRTIEQAPGPEDLTLRVTGFALYSEGVANKRGMLFERLVPLVGEELGSLTPNILLKSLHSQVIPFEVTERWTQPASRNVSSVLYGDCLLTNFTHPVNITTITITEEAQLQPTFIE